MKIHFKNIAMAMFLLGSIVLFTGFNISKPRILILHSYDKNYPWVRDVNIGLNRVLDKRADYTVRWYYMDTKRHPSPEFGVNAGISARRMIDDSQPDIVIAVDDDAQKYVSQYYVGHPSIKIIFAGVNNQASAYRFENARNVTGILERIPLAALKECLQVSSPQKTVRLQFIGDHSTTVKLDDAYIQQFNWHPMQLQASKLVDTYDEWKQVVKDSAGKTDYLIISGYRKITRSASDHSLVPPKELMAWTESHSPVPLIGVNAFVSEEGGMLAIGTSGYEQGEVAAKLAVELLDHHTSPQQLPFVISHQFVVAMRAPAMRSRQFELPQVYEAAARASNKFYE